MPGFESASRSAEVIGPGKVAKPDLVQPTAIGGNTQVLPPVMEKYIRDYETIFRYRNVTICPLVQSSMGEKFPPPVPLVTPLETAQITGA